ncbi:Bifunctional PGK/TIM [Polaribacter huanghezhanensis]|uniref:triose-phosphate isomerase n=1 Tax=Polaribacter huanghezhanensis TaxID=1354726 RepID=UPI00264932E7|nr:triose-phosphate isomerase [Polaribacter huanghezhanensis]WKD86054.1 Bifunctional PGK/TIM [Polaribacter huanghezhanensis]
MRSKIVAGNWKMNNDAKETKNLVKGIRKAIKRFPLANTRVLVAPAFVNLRSANKKAKKSNIEVVAQNMHQENSGAFTGEISADMLQSIGIKTVIIGHSERRSIFGETDELLAQKVNQAIEKEMEVIFCFGEQLEDRKTDNHFTIVQYQLEKGLFHLEAIAWNQIVLAYEPVWAIGTGETASPEQAQEMHAFIRKLVQEKYNTSVADNTSILYGGSVKPSNANKIFSKEDVDGGLIGGASLNIEDFTEIIKAI